MTNAHEGQLTVKMLVCLSYLKGRKVKPRYLFNKPIHCFTQTFELTDTAASHGECLTFSLHRSHSLSFSHGLEKPLTEKGARYIIE